MGRALGSRSVKGARIQHVCHPIPSVLERTGQSRQSWVGRRRRGVGAIIVGVGADNGPKDSLGFAVVGTKRDSLPARVCRGRDRVER
jgi:hypothetical protein